MHCNFSHCFLVEIRVHSLNARWSACGALNPNESAQDATKTIERIVALSIKGGKQRQTHTAAAAAAAAGFAQNPGSVCTVARAQRLSRAERPAGGGKKRWVVAKKRAQLGHLLPPLNQHTHSLARLGHSKMMCVCCCCFLCVCVCVCFYCERTSEKFRRILL